MAGDLTSAAIPPVGPEDHVRGEGGPVLYADFACPRCAMTWQRLRDGPLVFRHFALAAKDPRSVPLARAAEAAALQGAFWPFADALFGDQGHVDDPHLWARAEVLGLDVARFDADRRSEPVAARVTAQTRGGMRAGVVTTPALFDRAGARVETVDSRRSDTADS